MPVPSNADPVPATVAILMSNVLTARPQDRDGAFAAIRATLAGSVQGFAPAQR